MWGVDIAKKANVCIPALSALAPSQPPRTFRASIPPSYEVFQASTDRALGWVYHVAMEEL